MSGAVKEGLARYYKEFLRVCELWPIDSSRPGRDFGAHIQSSIEKKFKEETIETAEAHRTVEALLKISTNYYRTKYPRAKEFSYTNLNMADYQKALSNDGQNQVEAQKTLLERILGVKKIGEREKVVNKSESNK